MSKEIEALEKLKKIDIIIDGCAWNYKDTDYKEAFDILTKALTELDELKQELIARQETENSLTQWVADLTTEITELKRDVKRFMELVDNNVSYVFVGSEDENDEFDELENKLSKVGKEE